MGVKDLWQILEPYQKTISINQLKNKRIAIDLSTWLGSEARSNTIKNQHLRGLYFRIVRLLFGSVMN